MRVEDHLLGLARIGAHEQHAAVAEPDMRHLHRRRHTVDHDDLVAPVELVGLARREDQRHDRLLLSLPRTPAQARRSGAPRRNRRHSRARELLKHPDSVSRSRVGFCPLSPASAPAPPSSAPASAAAAPCGRTRTDAVSRPQNLANRVPRHRSSRAIALIVSPLHEVRAPNLPNRIHRNHPPRPLE